MVISFRVAAGGGSKRLGAVYMVRAATAKLDRPCFVVGQVLRCGPSWLFKKVAAGNHWHFAGQIESSLVRLQGQSLYDGFVSLMVRSGKSQSPRNNGKSSGFLFQKESAKDFSLHRLWQK